MKIPVRSALAAALLLAGSAFAATTVDSTTVRIISSAGSETLEVPYAELEVGQSRQIAAASGTPAIVTRTADGLRIEMAGEVTDVRMPDAARIALVDGSGDGERRVRVLKLDGADGSSVSVDGERKVFIKRIGDADGDATSLDHAELETLLSEAGADGETRVVVRHARHPHGGGKSLDDADLDTLLSQFDVDDHGDGKKVIVINRVGKEAAPND